MKKIILAILATAALNAKTVDKVVASVDGQAVTSYEVAKTAKEMNLSPQQALNYIIDQKLLKEQADRLGVSVSDFDIENAMQKIANKNSMSLFEFKAYLQSRGELKKFKEQLKNSLLKQKLFAQIVNSQIKISPQEIKNYYQNHKNDFSVFKSIQVTAYYAKDPALLEKLKTNPLFSGNVITKTYVYSYNDIPQNLVYIFKKTKAGEFTPVMNQGTNFVMYYIDKKDGKVVLPFDEVKNIIANKIYAQKREQILNSYLSKLKNQADIKIYN